MKEKSMKVTSVSFCSDGAYEYIVPEGDLQKSWGKVITSIDASKTGGYALLGEWRRPLSTQRDKVGSVIGVGSKRVLGASPDSPVMTSFMIYILTPIGLLPVGHFDRVNTLIVADFLALTEEERIETCLKQTLLDSTLDDDFRLVIETYLTATDLETNITDIDSAALAIVLTGYRASAKRHHPDIGGSPVIMHLLSEAKKQLTELLFIVKNE